MVVSDPQKKGNLGVKLPAKTCTYLSVIHPGGSIDRSAVLVIPGTGSRQRCIVRRWIRVLASVPGTASRGRWTRTSRRLRGSRRSGDPRRTSAPAKRAAAGTACRWRTAWPDRPPTSCCVASDAASISTQTPRYLAGQRDTTDRSLISISRAALI